MIVNSETLALAFKGFKTVYSEAYLEAPSHSDKIAMTVPSASRDETYGWLGMFPKLREWIGQRQVNSLKAHGFTITNRSFESTVSVKRVDVADDRLGVFKPFVSEMGRTAKQHPDELIFQRKRRRKHLRSWEHRARSEAKDARSKGKHWGRRGGLKRRAAATRLLSAKANP